MFPGPPTAAEPAYRVPDFTADAEALRTYENMKAGALNTALREARETVERRFGPRKVKLEEMLENATADRARATQAFEAARTAYAKVAPRRIKPPFGMLPPTFLEWIRTPGAKRVYRDAIAAQETRDKVVDRVRTLEESLDGATATLANELVRAEEETRDFYSSAEGYAQLDTREELRDLVVRRRAIEEERANYAERLERGKVGALERRDRALALEDRRILDGNIEGFVLSESVVVLEDALLPERWLLGQDKRGREWVMPWRESFEFLKRTTVDLHKNGNGTYTAHESEKMQFGKLAKRRHEGPLPAGGQFDEAIAAALQALTSRLKKR